MTPSFEARNLYKINLPGLEIHAKQQKDIYMFRRINILVMQVTRRTTVLLEKDVYDALVKESLEEYNSSKGISKVLNKIVKRSLTNKGKLRHLIHSKTVAKITNEEFERFRHGLSKAVQS